ncbi:hypothetical protein CONPUDRAFT_85883 [Coniophora puteana RWD-64-598 SS2]|uniref:Nucleotidyltransferase n=1 Tax=Coniophora puteana (strain RWD-64-598) TaxID=741705 RepID=R7SE12_CONPW|nr:uncharacterized protein CONPUDRAFT_85883 [Coniophora puteana RWD-64-598 SS2]EIW74408.1 hypothetical protein CONPUDRAFT_85883 [Coniophora puteana RWD-64-598 SS2]
MPTGKPTREEIRQVARTTASLLEGHGMRCCVFGSAACAAFGAKLNRVPRDVDMLVLTTRDAEYIKRLIADSDNNYTLVRSRAPGQTYKILWLSLRGNGRRCKVDILTPGTLGLPRVPSRNIAYPTQGIPCMPLIALLGMKLRGWKDHRNSHEVRYHRKQWDDVDDIKELLQVCVDQGFVADANQWLWMDEQFRVDMGARMLEFVQQELQTKELWEEIGFEFEVEEGSWDE